MDQQNGHPGEARPATSRVESADEHDDEEEDDDQEIDLNDIDLRRLGLALDDGPMPGSLGYNVRGADNEQEQAVREFLQYLQRDRMQGMGPDDEQDDEEEGMPGGLEGLEGLDECA